jgi:hypothetical protein
MPSSCTYWLPSWPGIHTYIQPRLYVFTCQSCLLCLHAYTRRSKGGLQMQISRGCRCKSRLHLSAYINRSRIWEIARRTIQNRSRAPPPKANRSGPACQKERLKHAGTYMSESSKLPVNKHLTAGNRNVSQCPPRHACNACCKHAMSNSKSDFSHMHSSPPHISTTVGRELG